MSGCAQRSHGLFAFCHEDIASLLAEPETYSNVLRFLAIPNEMGPPVHGQDCEARAANFEQEQMARVEPRTREIVASLLVPIFSSGEAEFIDDFATPFALKTLCALISLPERRCECLGD